jgi:hypothetical protein
MNDEDVRIEREVHHVGPRRSAGFIWGMIAAFVIIAVAFVVFLVASDDDDDGQIDLDVPAVDVDVETDG